MTELETPTAKNESNSKNGFLTGLKDGIPIALGYLSVSFSFGMMALKMGIPGWAAVLMSVTNLTSAGQFAGVGILAAGGGLAEMALTQLVINLRYSLMSTTLSQKVDGSMNTLHRMLASFFITDEIFAVASGKAEKVGRRYLYGLGFLPLLGWGGGTLLGVLAGQILPVRVFRALSVALYAMFVAIILPPAKRSWQVTLVILTSVALSCLLRYLPVFSGLSGGFSIILCAVISAGLGALFFPIPPKEAAV